MNLRHAVATYRGHTIPHFPIIERRKVWFAFSGVADRAFPDRVRHRVV